MITLRVAYNDNSEGLVKELNNIIPSIYPLVNLETYHENIFKERKKSFKLRSSYSARQCPFAILFDENEKVISIFYNESNDCTLEKIKNVLNNYVTYGQNS